ncbi:MAG: protein FilA [Moraxellaceae bacterium]|nr:MAG: protein FilA [Moraxellaceae bacterium]
MKLFTKLALVSAIAVSGQAMAMQSLDDSALSAATGQDGIDLTIVTSGITIDKVLVHDNDGLDPAATNVPVAFGGINLGGTGEAGAIVVNNVSVAVDGANANPLLGGALAHVVIDTDGGTAADGSGAFLNINATTNAIAVGIGGIAIGKSNAALDFTNAASGARRGVAGETEILGAMNINVGASNLNIQLGAAQPQGALILAKGVIQNGITISGLDLKDNVGGGAIGVDTIKVTSAGTGNVGNANLVVNTKIGVNATGLTVQSSGSQDIYLAGVKMGDLATAGSIGDVEIQGLNMGNSMIMVSGH